MRRARWLFGMLVLVLALALVSPKATKEGTHQGHRTPHRNPHRHPSGQGIHTAPPTTPTVPPTTDHAHSQAMPLCGQGSSRFVLTHHKSGTVFSRHAADALNSVLSTLCGTKLDKHHVIVRGSDDPRFKDAHWANNTCWMHVRRDPFEMVVSGYLYHRAAPEAWLHYPMPRDECDARFADQATESMRFGLWMCEYLNGVQGLALAATRGQYGLPPPADRNESYAAYLNRVTEEHGLLAELVAARSRHAHEHILARMRQSKAAPCSTTVCLVAFDKPVAQCQRQWLHALERLRYTGDALDLTVRAATTACSQCRAATPHQSTTMADSNHLNHSALPDLLRTVRRLDAEHFSGSVAELARAIGCSLHQRYLGPDPAQAPAPAPDLPHPANATNTTRPAACTWELGNSGVKKPALRRAT